MLCCVCLLETPKMLNIFDKKGRDLSIADVIDKHFWFETHPDDSLTSHICTICWTKIEDFHEFYRNVEKTHQSFQQNQHKFTDIKEEKVSIIKEEVEQELNSFESNLLQIEINIKDVLDDENESVEKNPLESAQFHDDYNEDEEFDNELTARSDDDEAEDILNEGKSENFNEKKEIKRKTLKRKYSRSEKKDDTPKRKRSSNRLDPILTEQLIKKHIPMLCDLCVFSGNTFADMVEHFKEHHSKLQPYVICCNRKLTRSHYVNQHAIIHENPNSFRCNECNRSFTTTSGLRTHNINQHAPEEKRIHACEFCPRRFGRRQLLEVHRQTHIPREEWTITCTKCTTRTVKFVSQYLLNIHNSIFHRRETNICHVCAKEIKDKKAFEKHVRGHIETSGPRIKCPREGCESWLKDEDILKQHLRLYHNQAKYECPKCGRICKNKHSFTCHLKNTHSTQTFTCEECQKSFKSALSLKEHMAGHTGEPLYSCPFCTRTFNTKSNMYSHKKKVHPIEWNLDNKSKMGFI